MTQQTITQHNRFATQTYNYRLKNSVILTNKPNNIANIEFKCNTRTEICFIFRTNDLKEPNSEFLKNKKNLLLLNGDIEENPGPSHAELKIFHLNINGLRNKVDELETEVWDYDVVIITETKLNLNIENKNISLSGFQEPIRKDRNDKQGGGVAVYFKLNMAVRRRSDLETNSIENICIEILSQPKPVILCAIYKPPNESVDKWNSVKEHLQKLTKQIIPNVIVAGDMYEDWLKQNPKPKLHTIYQELGLIQHIPTATRIINNSATLIDHIVTNLQDNVTSSGTIPCDLSDQHATYLHLNWRQNLIEKQLQEIWYYDQGNYNELNAEFGKQNWDDIIDPSTRNINDACTKFTTKMIDIARKHIPTTKVRINPLNKPWYTAEMRKLKKKMLRLCKHAQNSQKETDWGKYRRVRNELNNKIRNAKIKYPEKLASELKANINKPKFWWKTVSELMKGKNTQSIPPLKHNDQVYYQSKR